MENLLGWSFMFDTWAQDGFVTTFGADTKLSWVAVDDIGTAAGADRGRGGGAGAAGHDGADAGVD
jgi:hypothetical protein